MNRASLEKNPQEVAAMFDEVAPKYDLTNDVLSFFQSRAWRKEVVAATGAVPGQRVLDIAAGTGSSAEPYADMGIDVVASDFSTGMLEVGKRRRPDIEFVEADAMDLPFDDNSFDVTTISFGLRNVLSPEKALAEMYRVTKPGGRVVVCEFSHPTWRPFRTVYMEYLMKALPEVAKLASSNPDAYVYLAESIADWPNQDELAYLLSSVGWKNVKYKNLTGGIVALHRGFKPQV
ncbi:demethylmenaquinone methyltransferase [Micrococcoides hystricis]|uniref:Demethylmenaquinone methyltransferase n=1 Tax=Micrococcoides hystricis TaxID=1572761 RepID=A0ABV6P8V6_9MICC